MKALWLDLSDGDLKVWVDATLSLPTEGSGKRLGHYRDIALMDTTPASAAAEGWLSMPWTSLQAKLPLPIDFWVGLEASRFPALEESPRERTVPLLRDFLPDAEVLFYPGTFDPWHEGHQACVDLAPAHLPLVVCPDRNPHKPLRSPTEAVEGYLRVRAQLKATPQTLLYPGFLMHDGANPTESWVHRLKARRRDLRVSLLVGHDSFANLSRWTRATQLVRSLHRLYVVPRGEDAESRAEALAWVRAQDGCPVEFLAHHPHERLSSTDLRK